MAIVDPPNQDPRCKDDRTVRALHEAAHAVVAVLIGLDFDSVTLPAADDTRVGLVFDSYEPDPDETLVIRRIEQQMTMRYAGSSLEHRLYGWVQGAGRDLLDAQRESEGATSNPKDAYSIRQLCAARARTLVSLAWGQIERVGTELLQCGKLDWADVASLVLAESDGNAAAD